MPTMTSLKPAKMLRSGRLHGLLWLGVCLLAACTDLDAPLDPAMESGKEDGSPVATSPESNAPGTNPLAGARFFREPQNRALNTAAEWRSTRPADAALLQGIGETPQAVWFNGWHADVRAGAASYVSGASSAHAMPVLVAYNVPQRDCGSYSAGGAGSEAAYLSWLRELAAGIGARPATVILEPDALAGMNCLSTTDRERRTRLLSQAVDILKSNAATVVYIDAGHARWISAAEMARRLLAANIARADGFALNVSNFVSNAENLAYGARLSGLVGGKHFVIDTSRNGRGPTATNEWCNPADRGLGVAPTANTGHALVDALLWIKRPGESDGSCNGGPSAGKWWPEYALGLAQRATTQLALH